MMLRPAVAPDVAAIAALHVASWQAAYRGIYSDHFLDQEAPAERLAYWTGVLASDRFRIALVAEDQGAIIGICLALKDEEHGFDALIDTLHVAPDRRGARLGAVLLGAVVAELIAADCQSMFLWVFENNHPARRFYQRLGAEVQDAGTFEVYGSVVHDMKCVWRDLPALVAACRGHGMSLPLSG